MSRVEGRSARRRTARTREWSKGAWATLILGSALATAVHALDELTVDLDRVDGDGWTVERVQASLSLVDEATAVEARIATFKLSAAGREFRDVSLSCPDLRIADDAISCPRARIDALTPGIGRQRLTGSLRYGRSDGSLDVALAGLQLGEGAGSFRASLRSGQWSVKADLKRASAAALLSLARDFAVPLPSLTASSGTLDLTVDARGAGESIGSAAFDVVGRQLTANNESGSLASDQLAFELRGSLRSRGNDLLYSIALKSTRGQAYAQPIFLDLGVHALSATAEGTLRERRRVIVDRFSFDHQAVARAAGRAELDLDHRQPLRTLNLRLDTLQFPGAYTSYLQPLLLDTNFKAMQTAGALSGEVEIDAGETRRVALDLRDLALDDGTGSFAIAGLQGQAHWRGDGTSADASDDDVDASTDALESRLNWDSGALFGLPLGPAQLRFVSEGRQFRLLDPTRIPVLDGALELESFRIRNAGTAKVAFIIDATIRPISVRELCRAFGWPEFGGQIGGVVSKLRMREGVVTLGTTLRAQVFDGEVSISDLRLEQPLGQWPRLYSNIALRSLDLDLVTSAFSFGRITGRLSGEIAGLQLFNWTPVAFDARLYTPPDDRSKHRISQRAVENIGSIGGAGAGVTAALSSGVLRFFDDFNYDRLGLSCRLRNEVCVMDGVAPAPNGGYYLVKGRGVPRIDVIGSSKRVDWPRLVRQLIAVTESGGPVVK